MAAATRQYAYSEATRLLCAGVYLDTGFRARVIEELVGHEERPAPPSLGVDVVSVLAHALRARRQEAVAAAALGVTWFAFVIVEAARVKRGTDGTAESLDQAIQAVEGLLAVITYAFTCGLLWLAHVVSGRPLAVYSTVPVARTRPETLRRWLGLVLRGWARSNITAYWLVALIGIGTDPFALLFPLLLTVVMGLYRSQVSAVMRDELGSDVFRHRPPIALPSGARYFRISQAVAREQGASLGLYDAYRPFVGVGTPFAPWSFALEIKRARNPVDVNGHGPDGRPPDAPAPVLTSRQILDLVKPRLRALRDSAARTSLDRLRDLEVEDFVYLPSGARRHEDAVYDDWSVRLHLDQSVDEGGEGRRYFLRVKVGAWGEQVVTTVLVRVHTQGGMLVLEVVPFVLGPIVEEYRRVDVIASRRTGDMLRESVRTLVASPVAGVVAGISALRTLGQKLRTWLAEPEHAPPDGPLVSVRELGSTHELSLFQMMDVSRYIKTVQDRIVSGVRDALRSSGCATDEFEQNVWVMAAGSQYIHTQNGGVAAAAINNSAVATGSGGSATVNGGGGTAT